MCSTEHHYVLIFRKAINHCKVIDHPDRKKMSNRLYCCIPVGGSVHFQQKTYTVASLLGECSLSTTNIQNVGCLLWELSLSTTNIHCWIPVGGAFQGKALLSITNKRRCDVILTSQMGIIEMVDDNAITHGR